MTFTLAYFLCQIPLILVMWDDIKDIDKDDLASFEKKEWGELLAMALGLLFAPLTMLAVAAGYGFKKAEEYHNKRLNEIVHEWEALAALHAKLPRHEFKKDLYNYHVYMRETARDLKEEHLKVVARVDRDDTRFDKELINAAIDELVERAFLKAGK